MTAQKRPTQRQLNDNPPIRPGRKPSNLLLAEVLASCLFNSTQLENLKGLRLRDVSTLLYIYIREAKHDELTGIDQIARFTGRTIEQTYNYVKRISGLGLIAMVSNGVYSLTGEGKFTVDSLLSIDDELFII